MNPTAQTVKGTETIITTLNQKADDRIRRLRSLCDRLEGFEGRLEPGPRPTAERDAKNPPSPMGLPGINVRLEEIDQLLNWFDAICSRLDNIA